jgi:hypothetical protein
MPTDDQLTQVQVKYANMLMSKPNVVGVAIGYIQENGVTLDEKGLVVMVREKVPESQLPPKDRIPSELDGVRVDVQEFGDITAQ